MPQTPEQISAMMTGKKSGSSSAASTPSYNLAGHPSWLGAPPSYLTSIAGTNPFYDRIVNTWNAGQGLTNWGASPTPEAISKGMSAYNTNRDTLAGLVAQANAWRPPQPARAAATGDLYGTGFGNSLPATGIPFRSIPVTGNATNSPYYNPTTGTRLYRTGGTWTGGRGGGHAGGGFS